MSGRCEELLEAHSELTYEALSDSEGLAEVKLKSLARELESCWAANQSVELAYAAGFVWCHIPELNDENAERSRHWLKWVLAREPEHRYAMYHLALLEYYLGNHDVALGYIGRIPSGVFATWDHAWRDHKLEEVALCCRLLKEPHVDRSQDIKRVLSLHCDREEVWPLPEELTQTILEIAQSAVRSETGRKHVETFLETIQQTEIAEVMREDASLINAALLHGASEN